MNGSSTMIGALVFALASAAFSGRDNQIHVEPPRIESAVTVDGVLDEAAWSQAARLTGFSQYAPVDGRQAENATEILVFYSPTAIYFGVRAQAAPGSVHATLASRDHIDADDAIQIFLNPFSDGRQALVFGVNPLGIQADGALVEGTGNRGAAAFSALASGRESTDLTPDYIYESKGRVTPEGYEIEIAIPFKTLRFPAARVQSWSLNVTRRVQSSGQEDSWTPAVRAQSSFLSQSGTLERLTDLRRGIVLDLNPVVTAKADGVRSGDRWTYDSNRPEVGGNVRWGVTPNLTLNGTANPDFSQVEADASQFTYDPRAALFFPEKRPFFLDGAELFLTPNNLIYTRQIAAPVAAVKLTGKAAGTDVALLSAADDAATSASGIDHPVFTIVRLQHNLRGASKVGLVYTDRIDGADSNRVLAADARLQFKSIYDVQLQAGASRTSSGGGAAVWAPIWQAIVNRDGRHFGLRYAATGIHDDFRAASGFISRGGVITTNLTHRGTWFGAADAPIQSFTASVLLNGVWQYKDVTIGDAWLEKKLHFNNSFTFKGGWALGASALVESFAFDQGLYKDYRLQSAAAESALLPFGGTPHLHNLDYVVTASTPQFAKFTGSVFYIWGRDENFFEWSSADIAFATYALDYRPTPQLRISPQYQLQSYDRRTDGSTVGVGRIPRLRVEYQVSRPVFVRFIGEYNSQTQDALRDDSRTNLPIVVRDPATGLFNASPAFQRNRFRIDALFSYQPTPGTVVFAGYGSMLTEPRALRFDRLERSSDGFYVKASYLFRL